jgi:hypothetical protein
LKPEFKEGENMEDIFTTAAESLPIEQIEQIEPSDLTVSNFKKILDEIVIDLLIFREGNFDDNTVIEAAYLFFASLDRNYGNDIDEFFEFREKKPKKGTSLKDTADLLFAVYEDMCGGELD